MERGFQVRCENRSASMTANSRRSVVVNRLDNRGSSGDCPLPWRERSRRRPAAVGVRTGWAGDLPDLGHHFQRLEPRASRC